MNFLTLILFLFFNKSLCCFDNINDHKYQEYPKVRDNSEDVKNTEDTLDKLYNKLEKSILKLYPNIINLNYQYDEDYQYDQDDEDYQYDQDNENYQYDQYDQYNEYYQDDEDEAACEDEGGKDRSMVPG
jgi:Skp family chaperone for outer membrane proteins